MCANRPDKGAEVQKYSCQTCGLRKEAKNERCLSPSQHTYKTCVYHLIDDVQYELISIYML